MKIGNAALNDAERGGINLVEIRVGTLLVWQRETQQIAGELVLATDGFLVKEPDGYLVI